MARRSLPRARLGPIVEWGSQKTSAFVAFAIYAAYLPAPPPDGASERQNQDRWIDPSGTVAILFNLVVINIGMSGLHSHFGPN